ncbi:GTPase IMAP family member 7-like isoform X3 [Dicentrarchus labrax]|uniref:GTPase IMAP family member 7-like isoform X2 n=1 Tax=Dicentrarchus labrax TaxID=13489 RepID=UPI0021F53019|nr:GTPase IMAP family member 7-like isoform X2 [Dicentrarchus labrax]XP_051258425.1 GTPase IMAP family member 7-like isoform X3 [Dicentrarchus labrax]
MDVEPDRAEDVPRLEGFQNEQELFQNRRIVILGPAAGKSSLGNTIFQERRFKIGHTFNSETRQCQVETKSVNERSITLIDTPGFFDTDRSEEELKPEIVRCITECAPGPHAFLIVLKVEKFTEQEQAVITKMCQYFSEEVFKYAIVVFTHGDQLPEGQIIEEFVFQNEFMSDLVEKCGRRCHVIDNKYWNQNTKDEYRNNQFQVEELLKSIDKIIEANKGNCYTNDMLQTVEQEIQQEEEVIRQSSENMSEKEIREQARFTILQKLLSRLADFATVALFNTYSIISAVVGVLIESVTGHDADEVAETPQEAAEAEQNKSDLGQTVVDGFVFV